MEKLTFSFVLLALLSFSTGVFGECPVPCICPETTVKNPEQLETDRAALVNALWTTTNTTWSPLVTQFVAKIQELYSSSNSTPQQVRYAENAILRLSNIQRNLDPKKCISACTYYTVFQALIEYYDDCCNGEILKVFDNCVLSDHYDSFIGLGIANAYKNLPCAGAAENSVFTPPKLTCKDNGYCYDFHEIWDLQGKFLPCQIRTLVRKMYKSKDCRHKYLAASFTYAMLDFNINYAEFTFDHGAKTEFLSYSTSEPIPECCCLERIDKLNYLVDRIKNQKNMALSQIREKYTVLPECCKNRE